MHRRLLLLITGLMSCTALAQGTAFTYQGRLEADGVPANGSYAFVARLFDAGDLQQGPTLCEDAVPVVNGLFTLVLDFGAQFAADERLLDLQVLEDGDCFDTSGFAQLAPRQPLTATPFAARALLAEQAESAARLDAPDGSPANAVFVDNNGNVGIGTTTPTAKLDVMGPMVISSLGDQADVLWLNTERSWVFRQEGTGAGTALKLQSVGGGGNKNFIIKTTGNVGIGNPLSPTHTVHIGTPAPTLALQDTDSGDHQVGYISYRDFGNSERAWVGYGTAGSPDFSIVNARSSGDIVLSPLSGDVVVNGSIDIGLEVVQSPRIESDRTSVACPAGKRALGGGCTCAPTSILESEPAGAAGWFCHCDTSTFLDEHVTAWVVCARVK